MFHLGQHCSRLKEAETFFFGLASFLDLGSASTDVNLAAQPARQANKQRRSTEGQTGGRRMDTQTQGQADRQNTFIHLPIDTLQS